MVLTSSFAAVGYGHGGGLPDPEPEDVAQDQGGPLAGRQQLQGGDEGQGDRLAGLDAGLGTWLLVGDALQEQVGVGLEPGDLADPPSTKSPAAADRLCVLRCDRRAICAPVPGRLALAGARRTPGACRAPW